MILSPHEIAYIAKATWPDVTSATTAVAVAIAESSGNTEALARSKDGVAVGNRDHGLFQISGRYQGAKLVATPNWRDPWVNAAMAFKIWREAKDSFTPWSVFKTDTYLTYMPDAKIAMAAPFPPPVDPVVALTGQWREWTAQSAVNSGILVGIGKHFT